LRIFNKTMQHHISEHSTLHGDRCCNLKCNITRWVPPCLTHVLHWQSKKTEAPLEICTHWSQEYLPSRSFLSAEILLRIITHITPSLVFLLLSPQPMPPPPTSSNPSIGDILITPSTGLETSIHIGQGKETDLYVVWLCTVRLICVVAVCKCAVEALCAATDCLRLLCDVPEFSSEHYCLLRFYAA
jgi:hypothetical protein